MPSTIPEVAKRVGVSVRALYNEITAGRLIITKPTPGRSIVLEEDEARWLAAAKRTPGKPGELVLKGAKKSVEQIAAAVAHGDLDRQLALNHLHRFIEESGLVAA